jgi:TP901-1 family phage major tail protein
MADKVLGKALLTGVGATATTDIAVERGVTLNMSADAVDVSTKGDSGWSDMRAGTRSWSVDIDCVWHDTDSQLAAAWTAYSTGAVILVDVADGTNTFSGSAYVTSHNLEGSVEGESSLSLSLVGSGALTKA